MGWSRSLEVNLVTTHVRLELYGVLTGYHVGFLVVIVQEIVNCRLVELASWPECITPDWTTPLFRNTTPIETKIVYIVLLAFLLQFG